MTDLYADDGYLDHYQFERDPFAEYGPDLNFFAVKRQSVLAELEHLARYSKLMLVVTGPKGSGKTVLRKALVAGAQAQVKNVVVVVSAKVDAAAMLQQVSDALELPGAEIAEVLAHIEQLKIAGDEVHLVVDNAELLDESALLFLQRIAQGVNDASARVFIFSDSSITPLLEKVADNADLHHVIVLEPWSEAETTEYIEQRLVAAGSTLDCFSSQQLATMYVQTQGWPGRINREAKECLLEQMKGNTRLSATGRAVTNLPYKHLGLLVLAVASLLLLWLWQIPDSEQQASVVLDGVNKVQRPLALEAVTVTENREELYSSVKQMSASARDSEAPIVKKDHDMALGGHAQWYKQQGASRYTLQVLGTRAEATARDFVQKNKAQYHYFKKQHQGQALYVVTYGSFVNRDAALQAVVKLPAHIRKDKPWPRTMLSIQQELR
ncbi:AAA family ATPase [Denitrificimonas sp. JX-1]|uniref:AAA family ATPase n=1 Tax=Denitrificimonas halotolerans TaxID=3098930 RepID=A0ABU5GPV0_9GAMM|nr:AAA family ATPase [Denitrificimonas sp. JX-1]MDY7218592.1 AAA family ATPase [Denitrificimonas sp. JX-1]